MRGDETSFCYAIHALSLGKRRAIQAVHAFARHAEGIAREASPLEERLRRLAAIEQALDGLPAGGSDPGMLALATARERFELPPRPLLDIVEGARMDARGTTYATFDDLAAYCRRLAGAQGRLYMGILGSSDPASAAELGDQLGVASRLTKILRDLRIDAEAGRVYIPAEDLLRYHLHDGAALDAEGLAALARVGSVAERSVIAGFDGGDVGQLYALMRFQVFRAKDWLHRGLSVLPLLDRRGAYCVQGMSGLQRRLLDHIQERPDRALAQPLSLSPWERAWVTTRRGLGRRRVPERHPAEIMR